MAIVVFLGLVISMALLEAVLVSSKTFISPHFLLGANGTILPRSLLGVL
ncbi:hypothetical protein JCM19233_402 [Vibrio astriarenae]|nr:hypothetical protein JCM19233_402 [Vibrio sp. C7]